MAMKDTRIQSNTRQTVIAKNMTREEQVEVVNAMNSICDHSYNAGVLVVLFCKHTAVELRPRCARIYWQGLRYALSPPLSTGVHGPFLGIKLVNMSTCVGGPDVALRFVEVLLQSVTDLCII